MVLIAVLWMVAALSIIVMGVTRSVREEAKVMSLSRQALDGEAVGDAAIQLVLQELVASSERPARLVQVDVVYRGTPVNVRVMPLNGLIDINGASLPLLTSLFAIGGGAPPEVAADLARATLEARTNADSTGKAERFEAIEDLLRVPGVDFSLYARLSPLITADLRGGGRVNPLAAPPGVLAVLSGGDIGVASRIAADRDAGAVGVDTSALQADFVDGAVVPRFRIEARVPLAGGAALLFARSVDLNARPREGMPWHTFQTRRSFETVDRKKS